VAAKAFVRAAQVRLRQTMVSSMLWGKVGKRRAGSVVAAPCSSKQRQTRREAQAERRRGDGVSWGQTFGKMIREWRGVAHGTLERAKSFGRTRRVGKKLCLAPSSILGGIGLSIDLISNRVSPERPHPPAPLSNSALLRNASWRGGEEALSCSQFDLGGIGGAEPPNHKPS